MEGLELKAAVELVAVEVHHLAELVVIQPVGAAFRVVVEAELLAVEVAACLGVAVVDHEGEMVDVPSCLHKAAGASALWVLPSYLVVASYQEAWAFGLDAFGRRGQVEEASFQEDVHPLVAEASAGEDLLDAAYCVVA